MRLFRTAYQDLSDEALMTRMHKGDQQAFDLLYERYSQKLLSYFYRMLNHDEEKAQDMLQDIFVKLIEKPHLFDPQRRFSTWLFAVASNMIKNEYRSREVRRIMVYPEDMGRLEVEGDSLEAYIDLREFGNQLEDALVHLSETHREVFLLRYQEGLPLKEIGEIMACSEGTVKSRLHYALRNLAGHLKAFDPKAG